jgi:uncharacterized protein YkwD
MSIVRTIKKAAVGAILTLGVLVAIFTVLVLGTIANTLGARSAVPAKATPAITAYTKYDDPGAFTVANLIEAINAARAAKGVQPVTESKILDATAQAHAVDMQQRGYYAHVSPDGKTPQDRIALALGRDVYSGENEDNICPGVTVSGEMKRIAASAEHYANQEDPQINYLGVGFVISSTNTSTCNGYLVFDYAQL